MNRRTDAPLARTHGWPPIRAKALSSLRLRFLMSSSLSPLSATLMHLPANVANKRLTAKAKPFKCNTYKNTGGGCSPCSTCKRWNVPTSRQPYPLSFHAIPHSQAQRPSLNPFLVNRFRTLLAATERVPSPFVKLSSRHCSNGNKRILVYLDRHPCAAG